MRFHLIFHAFSAIFWPLLLIIAKEKHEIWEKKKFFGFSNVSFFFDF